MACADGAGPTNSGSFCSEHSWRIRSANAELFPSI